jgi:hypothetical protein
MVILKEIVDIDPWLFPQTIPLWPDSQAKVILHIFSSDYEAAGKSANDYFGKSGRFNIVIINSCHIYC